MPIKGGFDDGDNTRTTKTEHPGDATLTAGASGVFGAYVQITAATTITYNYLLIMIDDPNTSNDYVITLASGAQGSEIDFIDEILFHEDLTGNSQATTVYPVKIRCPEGIRLAARVRAVDNTDTIDIHLLGQGF